MTPEFRPAKVVHPSPQEFQVRIGEYLLAGWRGAGSEMAVPIAKMNADHLCEEVNAALASAVRERFKFVEEALEKIEHGLECDTEIHLLKSGGPISASLVIAKAALERLRREFGS